jgi:hypothetical protein
MIDKEYLKELKEQDYIAWDSLVNDPMITGEDTSGGLILPAVVLIVVIGIIIGMCF